MVTAKVRQYDALRKKEDTLSPWRECLEGGDAAAGKRIFFEKQEVSCVRCHMIGKEGGGNVGPNLIDLGKRQGREYILESIVLPNAKIAPGYESAGVKLNDGKFLVGVVKNETDDGFQLDTGVDQGIVTIKKSDIKFRKPAPSPMPDDIAKPLTKQELRNLVEYLSSQKG
jgi:quinoprotein glucose dehydrogenase